MCIQILCGNAPIHLCNEDIHYYNKRVYKYCVINLYTYEMKTCTVITNVYTNIVVVIHLFILWNEDIHYYNKRVYKYCEVIHLFTYAMKIYTIITNVYTNIVR